jgi:hypothetical protein
MIPYKNDYIIEKLMSEQFSKEQIFLQRMFGRKIDKNNAQAYLERILDHKWYVSERLGRDIGLPVAALDFSTNIEPLPITKRCQKNITGGKLRRAMKFGLTA